MKPPTSQTQSPIEERPYYLAKRQIINVSLTFPKGPAVIYSALGEGTYSDF
jgi:hypothetical protein